MAEIDIALIKKRSLSGMVALTSRTFFLQVIAFIATFLLTVFLSPSAFGVFYLVSAFIAFLGYFSDIGLAAALIQKKESLTREDLVTTFTIQQVLVGLLVILSLALTPSVTAFYHLDADGAWLFRVLVISFFLSSLKTIPSVLLERKLEFGKLILPQILETVGFYATAVILAWAGLGIASFTWAVAIRAVVGLIAMYVICPWPVGVGFSRPVASKLLRFGLPFQANSFLALLKDDLMTVYLGRVLPLSAVGYIGWAKKWSELPLRLIMDNMIRITFPAFSRLQHSRELLSNAVEKTIFGMSITVFPISVALMFAIRPIVMLVPKYAKWEPAIPSFYLFVVAAAIASLSTPLINTLNAIGKIRTTLKLMVMWTVLAWGLTVLFLPFFGFHGFAAALTVLSLTLVVVIIITKKILHYSFLSNIQSGLAASFVQGVFYFALFRLVPTGIAPLLIVLSIGVILYGGIVYILERKRIATLLALFSKSS